jgi:hypothetical protein
MPSQPSAQAWWKMIAPSPLKFKGDAVADASEEIGERRLATLERLPAEVGTVELYEIESAQHGGVIANPIAENVKDREAALVDYYGLTVEQARSRLADLQAPQ